MTALCRPGGVTSLAQLGDFSKFPFELRLIIWDFLLSRAAETPLTNYISIISCSSFLYHEISHRFYQDFSHAVMLRPVPTQGILVHIYSHNQRNFWDLQNDDNLKKYLDAFIRANGDTPRITVIIHPTSPVDPSGIIGLWNKSNTFVDTLRSLAHISEAEIPLVTVRLMGEWVLEEIPRRSIRGSPRRYPNLPYYREDHDDYYIALLPFLQLSGCKFDLPPDLEAVLSHGMPDSIFSEYQHTTSLSSDDERISGRLLNTRIWLDIKLDDTLGKTGGILRRDRFKNWFPDNADLTSLECKSTYEEQIMGFLMTNSDLYYAHDLHYDKLRRRHQFLFLWHDKLHREKEYPDETPKALIDKEASTPYTTWNSEIWLTRLPHGIPFIDTNILMWDIHYLDKRGVYSIYWTKVGALGKIHDHIGWWLSDAKRLFPSLQNGVGNGSTAPVVREWPCSVCKRYQKVCRWCKLYDTDRKCVVCREFIGREQQSTQL
ncbi:hypothetical protein N7456_002856 [Penicillium angulare]|uniref:Uncharacterized protein n=1 Tax=Penicillium angulare TaxID=116970 RepID=A0A9W9FTI9_9EURO|nr:hypothetical protein N7456_002856 [Penicillium angulare]